MTTPHKPKLIEVALPLETISKESVREKSLRHGHPSTLHLWWARRPLAAARAVLWSSLVDDPTAHPDRFPTEEEQDKERRRLFGILERLVVWENSNDPEVLSEAHNEIKESCDGDLPNILDPFCGGGTIPLEAGRLGLPSFGGDLNPVAVLITKALTEIPNRFANMPPINPKSREESKLRTWQGAQGLAEDIRYYGELIREKAWESIGHLYPKVKLPKEKGGGEATAIAWLWARTVKSPDPSWPGHVPLIKSGILRNKSGKPIISVEPVVDRINKKITYKIREGLTSNGTMATRGNAVCIATGTAISKDYIKQEATKNNWGTHLLAVVVKTKEGREYLPPDNSEMYIDRPTNIPTGRLSKNSRYMVPTLYGLETTDSLFTNRQLVAISTFSKMLQKTRSIILFDATKGGLLDDGFPLRDGGSGAIAYAETIMTYLAFAVDRCTAHWSSQCVWHTGRELMGQVFGRQAIPMVWDFAEANPFSSSSGNWTGQVNWVAKAVSNLPSITLGEMSQRNAIVRLGEVKSPVVSTDPPYYDNVPYADLSDFFYVWIRHNLSEIWPDILATILTPKKDELVADNERAGSKVAAKRHFEEGMYQFMSELTKVQNSDFPATIFYAFKQQEAKGGKRTSTGWETFLQALVDAGLMVTATWPMRTEMSTRMRATGSAALASSIVIALRNRPDDAPMETRGGFVSALRNELPGAIRLLQKQNIAPVDMAQSAIGPGMRIFSRYSKVVEADGSAMPVRTALALINEVLGEVLSEEEAELDADSRFALTWFEQFGYEPGPYGDADVLARAKVTAVDGVVEAGIAESRGGKVRLLRREELEEEWSPVEDKRRTDWEAAQHLIRLLDRSEAEAAGLLGQLGGVGDRARQLAYLLYAVCEGKNWSEEAVAYNGLIAAWPELTRLVATTGAGQQSIL